MKLTDKKQVSASTARVDALDADDALGILAGADNFTVIVMAAMGADMVRALQLAAIRAFSMRFGAQSLVAAAHPGAGRRGFAFRNGHENTP